MHIDRTDFGNITIDGKSYEYDVIVRSNGEIRKRKKKLSKRQYGTSHIISEAEAKYVFEDGCRLIVIGSGQQGNVRLSPEAAAYFDKKGCKVLLEPTPEAIHAFNRASDRKVALMHVTC